jgi:invasion protein IalB
MYVTVRTAVAIAAVAVGMHPSGANAQSLPGGASQVQETHGDWRVTCAQQNGQKQCALAQQQTDKDSRQLVLGIELKAASTSHADGTMVLPFGLAVDQPVMLQIDESGAPQTLHFRTCLPVGCLVPLVFDAAAIARLRAGASLNVKTTAAEGGRQAAFRISLKGFGSALDRTAELSK